MSSNKLINTEQMLGRRTFLQMMAGTAVLTILAACQPITLPVEPTAADNVIGEGKRGTLEE